MVEARYIHFNLPSLFESHVDTSTIILVRQLRTRGMELPELQGLLLQETPSLGGATSTEVPSYKRVVCIPFKLVEWIHSRSNKAMFVHDCMI
jgi:hypothetical protein